jgi:hypothetical protein
MVETEGTEQADEGRFWYSQETNDVGRWQEENCRSAKAEMGEGQSSEGRLEHRPFPSLVRASLPTLGVRFLSEKRFIWVDE